MLRRALLLTWLVTAMLALSSGSRRAGDPSGFDASPNRYLTDRPFHAVGYNGVAVTEEANATRVAVEILRAGGNAVDAAVAAAFALAVTFPEAGNLGGNQRVQRFLVDHGQPAETPGIDLVDC